MISIVGVRVGLQNQASRNLNLLHAVFGIHGRCADNTRQVRFLHTIVVDEEEVSDAQPSKIFVNEAADRRPDQ